MKQKNILIITRDFSKEVSTRFERIIMIPVKGMAEHLRGLSVDQILAPKQMNSNEREWFKESIFPLTIGGHKTNMKITYY